MKIRDLHFYIVNLPFRFTFKHSLAERSFQAMSLLKH